MMACFLSAAILILFYFTLLFFVACRIRNYAIADVGWGAGFILIALMCIYLANNISLLFWLVFGLICLWGTRLSIHIYLRNKGKPEDFRYQQFRTKWIKHPYLNAYVKLYLTQALLTLIVSTAILIAAFNATSKINIVGWLFFSVAFIGLLYESISDFQLVQFKKASTNAGKVMQQGLWRYSRHPNYFGEIIFWWGISLLTVVATGNYFALVSGITMNWLIVFVSGVPMLEAKYKSNPAYEEYIRTTNSLFPIKFH